VNFEQARLVLLIEEAGKGKIYLEQAMKDERGNRGFV